jgi:phosphatase NudJ
VVELQSFVGVYQYYSAHNDTLYLRVAFRAEPVEHTGIAIDPDIAATLWLTLEEIELLEQRSPLVLACIHDALQRPGLPLSVVSHFI